MPEKKSLQPHIYLPLPSLKDLPKSPSKEERLRNMISNLDRHHNTVRQRIVSRAKTQQTLQLQSTTPNSPISNLDQQTRNQANDLLLRNLNAPYIEGSGDPCMKFDAPLPAPPAGLRQATPPREIRQAKEALDQIDLYDQHAKPARDYYEKALRRMTQGRGMSVSSAIGGVGIPPPPPPQRSYSGDDPRRRGR